MPSSSETLKDRGDSGTSVALLRLRQKVEDCGITGIEMYYEPVSRVLTRNEIQLYSYCGEERVAAALAQLVTLPDDASYDMIEQAVIKGLAAMKECDNAPSVEAIHAERRYNHRPN
ncbi:MAG: hypothetical protein LAO56_23615 [Acidobacteriia bacterium]|nr:hypothetical protein [Terriglobia bacterium]